MEWLERAWHEVASGAKYKAVLWWDLTEKGVEMNWSKRHLNWTCVLGYPLGIVVLLVVSYLVGITGQTENTTIGVGVAVAIIAKVVLDGWVIRQKGRSLWWLLFLPLSGWGLPLWLENKKMRPESSDI